MPSVRAVSFDLWDTLVFDDSHGRGSSKGRFETIQQQRRDLVWEALRSHRHLRREDVAVAFDVLEAALGYAWRTQATTWPLEEAMGILLRGLRCKLPATDLGRLVEELANLDVDRPPELVPGIIEALAALHGRFRLCVISDAVLTPGRSLRSVLAHHGLLSRFDALIFSDEVGRSKPHPSIFKRAAEALSVTPPQMIHIGDRQRTDVAGAQAVGMRAVLLTASRDKDRLQTTADAVCERAADLPRIINELAGEVGGA